MLNSIKFSFKTTFITAFSWIFASTLTAQVLLEKPLIAYNDLVKPILEQRCYSCHNDKKSKGELRLDTPEFITKGGDNGAIIVAGKAKESTIYKRLILPMNDDEHMPPDNKEQLTAHQIELIRWWIDKGASFTEVYKDIPTPSVSELKKVEKVEIQSLETVILQKNVEAASSLDVQNLRALNIIIANFGEKSNYLTANFVNVKNFNSKQIEDLQKVKNQLIRLKLASQPVTDSDIEKISKLTNITRLNLEKTTITNAGLIFLKDLPNLEQLNIYGTNISDKGLEALALCKNLKVLYLWGTKTTAQGIEKLTQILRGVRIDVGGAHFDK